MNKKIICISIVGMFLLTSFAGLVVVGMKETGTTDVMITNIYNEKPSKPVVEGPTSGKVGDTFTFTAVSEDPEGEDILYVFLLHKIPPVHRYRVEYIEQEIFPIQPHTEDEGGLFKDLQENPDSYTYCQSGTKAEVSFTIDGIGAAGEYRITCYALTSYNGNDEGWHSSGTEHYFKVKPSSSKSVNIYTNSLILKFLENFPILLQFLQRLPAYQ